METDTTLPDTIENVDTTAKETEESKIEENVLEGEDTDEEGGSTADVTEDTQTVEEDDGELQPVEEPIIVPEEYVELNKATEDELESLVATINEEYKGIDESTLTEVQCETLYKISSCQNSKVIEYLLKLEEAEEEQQSSSGYKLRYPLVDRENYVFPMTKHKIIITDTQRDVVTDSQDSITTTPPVIKKIFFKLNSNHKIPMVGFGTYHFKEQDEITNVIDKALSFGYRLFDTASAYKNEAQIGNALEKLLPKYNLKREDIFLTSKLNVRDHDDGVQPALLNTLNNLKTKYIDLYLIIWPGHPELPHNCPYNAHLRKCTWAAMVTAKKLGFIKSIGVSNYTIRQLQHLLNDCYGVKPAVNQIEWHPHHHDEDMRNICRQHGILIQGYYSLGGQERKALFKKTRKLRSMSKCLEVSREQLRLRWSLQKNVGLILRGRTDQQIMENMDLDFELCCDCMKLIDKLSEKKPTRLGADTSDIY